MSTGQSLGNRHSSGEVQGSIAVGSGKLHFELDKDHALPDDVQGGGGD